MNAGLLCMLSPSPLRRQPRKSQEAPNFRFDIGGTWDDLEFTPDVRDLIRRSGAAAPLFSQQRDSGKPLSPGADSEP